MPIELPDPTTQPVATIKRIELKQAKDIFTSKETGQYAGNPAFRKPTDMLYVFYGVLSGQVQEIRLGTANTTEHLTGSNLLQIINNTNVDRSKVKALSDDLHELVGCTVKGFFDSRGFFRLLPR